MSEQEIVEQFSERMLAKIEQRRDRYVPFAWSRMDKKRLIFLMKQEIEELEKADSSIEEMDEALDIANYAMFIHEISK